MNRLSKLVDDEIEADEEFWNQDAFKEVCFGPLSWTLTRISYGFVMSSFDGVLSS